MTRESFVVRDEADLFRTGRGPRFDPTPRAIGVSLDVVEGGELAVEPRDVTPVLDPASGHLLPAYLAKPTPARVPEWVQNPERWQSMTRAERRATERHHRSQGGR